MAKLMSLLFGVFSVVIFSTSSYLLLYYPISLNIIITDVNLTYLFMSLCGYILSIVIILLILFISRIIHRTAKNTKGYITLGIMVFIIFLFFISATINFIISPLVYLTLTRGSLPFLVHYSILEIIGYGSLVYAIKKYSDKSNRYKIVNFMLSVPLIFSLIGFISILILGASLFTLPSFSLIMYVGYFIPSFIIIALCCIIGFWLSIKYWNHEKNPKHDFASIKMVTKGKKVCIYIPAYNAAYTLPNLIDRIQDEVKDQIQKILVIDDHSPDNTYLLAVGLKKKLGLSKMSVYRTLQNQRYGGNQKLGYALSILEGFDIVVMLHGDAQYAPELIPQIIEPIVNEKADMVFGSRMQMNPLKGGMPPVKFLGNKVLTFVENLILGTNFSEFHSGYRAYSCNALLKIPFLRCTNEYHFDTEIIIQLVLANMRITEVPIPTYYGKEVSRVGKFRYGINILQEIISYYLIAIGLSKSDKFDLSKVSFAISDIEEYIRNNMVNVD